MTVSTEVDHNEYSGNGVTTSFPYTFRIFKKGDLVVQTVDLSENIRALTLGTDYTVTGAGKYNGGNVVLTSPLANGWRISLSRELPVTQETDLRNQGKFFADVHEDAFDKLTMLIQQCFGGLRLALRRPSFIANFYDSMGYYIRNLRDPSRPQDAATKNYVDGVANTNLSHTLRTPEEIPPLPGVEQRKNKIVGMDNNGNPVMLLPESGSAADVLIELAKPTGAARIGTSFGDTVQDQLSYTGGKVPSTANTQASVKGAVDRLTERVIYAELYGVVADGVTDNTDALSALSIAVSAMTDPYVKVVFPQGVIKFGRQRKATAPEVGFSYQPTYEQTGFRGWFCVDGRLGKTVIEGSGTTFKLNDGMKTGAFDPVTGLPAPDQISGTPNPNYKAYAGHGLSILRNEDVEVIGLKLDGNARGGILGGKWGDDGWQCDSFGIWCAENIRAKIKKAASTDWALDSLYLAQASTWTPSVRGIQRSVQVTDCEFSNSRRQGISIAGGQHIDINRTVIRNIGRYADGAASFYSAPEACIDIETEASTVQDVIIRNSQLLYGRYTYLAAVLDSNAKRCIIDNCLLRNNSEYTSILSKMPGLIISNSTLEGGGIDFQDGIPSSEQYPMLLNCVVKNHINGAPVANSRIVGKVAVVNNTLFNYLLNPGWIAPLAIARPTAVGNHSFQGNGFTLFGSSTGVPVNAGGRIDVLALSDYRDIDLIMTDGSTGTTNFQVTTSGITVNAKGITSDSNKFKDSVGNTVQLINGRYTLPLAQILNMQRMLPDFDGLQLGDDTHRFGDIFSKGSIFLISPNGTKYRISVNNSGALQVNPQ